MRVWVWEAGVGGAPGNFGKRFRGVAFGVFVGDGRVCGVGGHVGGFRRGPRGRFRGFWRSDSRGVCVACFVGGFDDETAGFAGGWALSAQRERFAFPDCWLMGG